MNTITIPKGIMQAKDDLVIIPRRDYEWLLSVKDGGSSKIKKMRRGLTSAISEIVADFQKTNLYSDAFLADLRDGLNKSSLGKKQR